MPSIFDAPKEQDIFSGKGTTGDIFGGRPDVSTSEGLLAVAEQKGLGDKAQTKVPKGEDPNRIFSGGFISDVFDTLNALQFGVAGILTGKGFVEGMAQRRSFTDSDLLGKYGFPGVIAGIAADIATDPLMLIPPLGIGKRILMGLKGGSKLITSTKLGNMGAEFLGKKFVHRFGVDPAYARLEDDVIAKINLGNQRAKEVGRQLADLTDTERKLLSTRNKAGQTVRRTIQEIAADNPDLAKKITPAFQELDELSLKLVDDGILPKEIYEKTVGSYVRNFFGVIEKGKKPTGFPSKRPRLDLTALKARQDLPDELRKSLEQIDDLAYPVARSLQGMNQLHHQSVFFNQVAGKFAVDTAQEGLKQLPKTARLGSLSGKFVPEPIFNQLNEIIRAKTTFEKTTGRFVQGFKFGKVILNPATHARNIISNVMLANISGVPAAKLPSLMVRAGKDMRTAGKYGEEIKKLGSGLDTYWGNEVRELLVSSTDPKVVKVGKNLANKMGELYQGEEAFMKRAVYIFHRDRGLDAAQAWAEAERALFNYAQVAPFVRILRESMFGMPFITFTVKSTPRIAESLITKPAVIGKYGFVKKGIEAMSPQDRLAEERKSEPDYIRNGYFVRLPFEDGLGRALYFDMTYILPFGDLMAGTLFQASKPGEALPERILSEFPLLNVIGELYSNEDFFGRPIVKPDSTDSLEIGVDIISYLARSYGPPPFVDTPGRIATALSLSKLSEDEIGQKRTITQEVIRNFGLKVQPFKLEQQQRAREREAREGVGELLKERGEIAEFSRNFIPKDDSPF